MKKVIAGSVLAAAAVAGLFGAGTASAAPGLSVSVDDNPAVGIGDHGPQTKTGAHAISTKGNAALAVSLIGPSQATAVGKGNTAFAFDGASGVDGGTDNHVFTSYGVTYLNGDDHRNTVVNAGSMVSTTPDGQAENQTSVSFCGTQLTAQSSHIKTYSMGSGGLC
jgi:hypothetical protein